MPASISTCSPVVMRAKTTGPGGLQAPYGLGTPRANRPDPGRGPKLGRGRERLRTDDTLRRRDKANVNQPGKSTFSGGQVANVPTLVTFRIKWRRVFIANWRSPERAAATANGDQLAPRWAQYPRPQAGHTGDSSGTPGVRSEAHKSLPYISACLTAPHRRCRCKY